MLKEQEEHRSQQIPYLQTLLIQLFIEMNRVQEISREPIAPESSEKQLKVYEMIDYLQAHYVEKLTLKQLSETFSSAVPIFAVYSNRPLASPLLNI